MMDSTAIKEMFQKGRHNFTTVYTEEEYHKMLMNVPANVRTNIDFDYRTPNPSGAAPESKGRLGCDPVGKLQELQSSSSNTISD
jgi:hypothetical protein